LTLDYLPARPHRLDAGDQGRHDRRVQREPRTALKAAKALDLTVPQLLLAAVRLGD